MKILYIIPSHIDKFLRQSLSVDRRCYDGLFSCALDAEAIVNLAVPPLHQRTRLLHPQLRLQLGAKCLVLDQLRSVTETFYNESQINYPSLKAHFKCWLWVLSGLFIFLSNYSPIDNWKFLKQLALCECFLFFFFWQHWNYVWWDSVIWVTGKKPFSKLTNKRGK